MFDIITLVQTVGYIGVTAIIFAESGLFFGFFLPGDSLLFTAGFLASQGVLHIGLLIFLTTIASIAGDSVGYWFGRKIGPVLFSHPDSRFFPKRRLEETKIFFEVHGSKSIVLARFIPAVRTFTPILAGVGAMRYRTFLAYNILGSLVWATGIPLLGYFLGASVPHADQYLLPVVLFIIFLSFIPLIVAWIKKMLAKRT